MNCTCGQIFVGNHATGTRNWNPDCLEHGSDSVWYDSPEQKEKRKLQNERLRELQAKAREARKNAQMEG